jgi:pimeloyl-ACP methyl ester carboxylesterase
VAPPELGPLAQAYARSAAAMRAAGEPYAGWAVAGRRFLVFDPRGDGAAVEAVGDPADADRIVILVPGVDSTLRDFDRGLGGVARRAPSVQAHTVYDALRAADPAARVSVLAWLGYDPPEGLGLAVARDDRARAGAAALTAFLTGLAAQRPRARVTVVGHSYGALVVGLAAPALGRQVTGLVALGAPGMGVDRVDRLRTGATVWSALAPDDWIWRAPEIRLGRLGHGTRPSTPSFGARPLPVGGVRGHDGYLVAGTETLAAITSIVLASRTEAAA